ncbi:hypothetical protein CE91St41_30080 [Oscillospiraceae bacterium]|nr:hypothetical protein CE91St40_30080 [Oscillospiraceae bacterium]BDF76119.1 hypothetical protein CE91St41_30080 [Oscillospiraceae bacterium]
MVKKNHYPSLILLIVFTYICNLFDLWYTSFVLKYVSNASEGNPFIEFLFRYPALLILYKFAVIPVALGYLYYSRKKPIAVFGLFLCAVCFGGVVFYQIMMIPHWKIGS